MRIAIIGGVAGGAGAAAAARRANESASITVFEAGPYVSFANCGLPYYLSGEIKKRESLLVTTAAMLAKRFRIDVRTRREVVAIDRKNKTLAVKDLATNETESFPYDRLIIAVGAKSIRPPTAGIDHARVVECRTIDDVDRLTAFTTAKPAARVLVIGGGFIGCEVAEALKMRGLSPTLLDLAPQVLPPLDPEIAAQGREELVRHGITVKLGAKVERFEHGALDSFALLSDGTRLDFDFAVLSIGVSPAKDLAVAAGLEIGKTGGLAVDAAQRTSDPDIFAAGDVTELLYWPTGARTKLALAGPANKQARVAGANAATPSAQLTTSGAAGTSIVRIFDLAIAMTGLSEKAAIAQKIPYKVVNTQNGHHAGYFPGAQPLFVKLLFSPEDGRILGGQIFGKEGVDKRIDVLAVGIQMKMTVDQLADVDLAYAPPFGAAKDPIVIAGMVASNVFHGRTETITARELDQELHGDQKPFVLDVRNPAEHEAARIEGATLIPVDELRDRLATIPKDRDVVVHCAVGYRGYVAERILRQSGLTRVRNLTGGFRAWTVHRAGAV